MKKTLKKFGSALLGLLFGLMIIAVLSALVISPPAKAAAGLGYADPAVATNMATGVVSTNNVLLESSGIKNGAAIQLNLLALGAGATNSCAVLLQKSVDNTYWTDAMTVQLTGTGATATKTISNVTASAVPYWRINTVTSTANGDGTNLNVEVWWYAPK